MFLKHVKTVKHVKTYIGNVGFIYITCLGLAIDAEWSAGLFLPGFLVEGFSMSGRLVFLKRFIFIFLIFKFLFKQFIFPH